MLRTCLIFFIATHTLLQVSHAQVIPISSARNLPIGTQVTIRGIVTNGAELGKVRFLQDSTAGIALYPGSGSQAGFESIVFQGDSIEATGTLLNYNGLLELSPITHFEVLAKNQTLPTPRLIDLNQLSELYEGQLVRLSCLSFNEDTQFFSGSGTFPVYDKKGESTLIYLNAGNPILGQSIPEQPMEIQAILSQYGSFQLLPRQISDFLPASCLYLKKQPSQSNISTTGFRLDWETSAPGMANLSYGTNPDSLNTNLLIPSMAMEHGVQLTNLEPGTIYWAQVLSFHNQDSVLSKKQAFSTQSLSSGQIKIYFNRGIDSLAANGLKPDGDSYEDLYAELLNRINSAAQTIDVTMYNNNRNDLIQALEQAHLRGVRVRYIAATSTNNFALNPAPMFPVLYGNNTALMHNKFVVIDVENPAKTWVMSGSVNWTTSNMTQDYNNALWIQDQALARAYTLEFEEMWGGSGAQPNLQESRFGNTKLDNTPHQFIIGGRAIELYFSPSDAVTSQITNAIQTANYQCSFSIFSFTKDEIGNSFVSEHDNGTWVRGIIENIDDPGAEYLWLLNNGVPVQAHTNYPLLHHKYAVLDAGYPISDPIVVTGSHNWTFSAENKNDENTLIIHDPDIATLYQAEFEQRWSEVSTSVSNIRDQHYSIYPNPAKGRLFIQAKNDQAWNGKIEIRDVVGRLWDTQPVSGPTAGIKLHNLPRGSYFITLITDRGITTFPIQAISR